MFTCPYSPEPHENSLPSSPTATVWPPPLCIRSDAHTEESAGMVYMRRRRGRGQGALSYQATWQIATFFGNSKQIGTSALRFEPAIPSCPWKPPPQTQRNVPERVFVRCLPSRFMGLLVAMREYRIAARRSYLRQTKTNPHSADGPDTRPCPCWL